MAASCVCSCGNTDRKVFKRKARDSDDALADYLLISCTYVILEGLTKIRVIGKYEQNPGLHLSFPSYFIGLLFVFNSYYGCNLIFQFSLFRAKIVPVRMSECILHSLKND